MYAACWCDPIRDGIFFSFPRRQRSFRRSAKTNMTVATQLVQGFNWQLQQGVRKHGPGSGASAQERRRTQTCTQNNSAPALRKGNIMRALADDKDSEDQWMRHLQIKMAWNQTCAMLRSPGSDGYTPALQIRVAGKQRAPPYHQKVKKVTRDTREILSPWAAGRGLEATLMCAGWNMPCRSAAHVENCTPPMS